MQHFAELARCVAAAIGRQVQIPPAYLDSLEDLRAIIDHALLPRPRLSDFLNTPRALQFRASIGYRAIRTACRCAGMVGHWQDRRRQARQRRMARLRG